MTVVQVKKPQTTQIETLKPAEPKKAPARTTSRSKARPPQTASTPLNDANITVHLPSEKKEAFRVFADTKNESLSAFFVKSGETRMEDNSFQQENQHLQAENRVLKQRVEELQSRVEEMQVMLAQQRQAASSAPAPAPAPAPQNPDHWKTQIEGQMLLLSQSLQKTMARLRQRDQAFDRLVSLLRQRGHVQALEMQAYSNPGIQAGGQNYTLTPPAAPPSDFLTGMGRNERLQQSINELKRVNSTPVGYDAMQALQYELDRITSDAPTAFTEEEIWANQQECWNAVSGLR
jgi:cell division protein FtsB